MYRTPFCTYDKPAPADWVPYGFREGKWGPLTNGERHTDNTQHSLQSIPLHPHWNMERITRGQFLELWGDAPYPQDYHSLHQRLQRMFTASVKLKTVDITSGPDFWRITTPLETFVCETFMGFLMIGSCRHLTPNPISANINT